MNRHDDVEFFTPDKVVIVVVIVYDNYIFLHQNRFCDSHWNCLSKAISMTIHKIWFSAKIKKKILLHRHFKNMPIQIY